MTSYCLQPFRIVGRKLLAAAQAAERKGAKAACFLFGLHTNEEVYREQLHGYALGHAASYAELASVLDRKNEKIVRLQDELDAERKRTRQIADKLDRLQNPFGFARLFSTGL